MELRTRRLTADYTAVRVSLRGCVKLAAGTRLRISHTASEIDGADPETPEVIAITPGGAEVIIPEKLLSTT